MSGERSTRLAPSLLSGWSNLSFLTAASFHKPTTAGVCCMQLWVTLVPGKHKQTYFQVHVGIICNKWQLFMGLYGHFVLVIQIKQLYFKLHHYRHMSDMVKSYRWLHNHSEAADVPANCYPSWKWIRLPAAHCGVSKDAGRGINWIEMDKAIWGQVGLLRWARQSKSLLNV